MKIHGPFYAVFLPVSSILFDYFPQKKNLTPVRFFFPMPTLPECRCLVVTVLYKIALVTMTGKQ